MWEIRGHDKGKRCALQQYDPPKRQSVYISIFFNLHPRHPEYYRLLVSTAILCGRNLNRPFGQTNLDHFQGIIPDGSEQGFITILSFRRVLYVVCFLLGNSPASEV